MEHVLAIVAPGQGAQTPGFLAPWLEDAHFASRLQELSDVVGLDLVHHGTEADAEGLALLNQQTGAHRGHTRKGGRRSG